MNSIYVILDPRKKGKYSYENMNISFIYEPIYVGRGKGNCSGRKHSHLKGDLRDKNKKKGLNKLKIRKVESIYKLNLVPIFLVIYSNLSLKETCDLEKEMISAIGKINDKNGPLTNITDGGESGQYGRKWTKEMKERHSKLFKQLPHYLRGKKMSQEMKDKLSESHKGHKASKETRQKLSDIRKGKKIPKARKKYSIISPEGEKIIFEGLVDFCNKNNLNQGDMGKLKNKKIRQSKGWTKLELI